MFTLTVMTILFVFFFGGGAYPNLRLVPCHIYMIMITLINKIQKHIILLISDMRYHYKKLNTEQSFYLLKCKDLLLFMINIHQIYKTYLKSFKLLYIAIHLKNLQLLLKEVLHHYLILLFTHMLIHIYFMFNFMILVFPYYNDLKYI